MTTPGDDNPIDIDVQAVHELSKSSSPFLLLDCRQPDEHAFAHIEGAKLLPMNEIPTRLDELAPHRDGLIVVHCHHGGRSLRVTHWLRSQGFKNVRNMLGGIDAWSQQIDASVPRYE